MHLKILLRVHTMHNVTRRIGLHRATWRQLDERRAPASVAQWSEHSSRKRKVRGSSPRRVTPCRFFYRVVLHLFIKLRETISLLCDLYRCWVYMQSNPRTRVYYMCSLLYISKLFSLYLIFINNFNILCIKATKR